VKTKSNITGYIIRSGVAAMFFSLALAAIVTATIPVGHSRPQEVTVTPDGGCGRA
jgi:hypothetical protein